MGTSALVEVPSLSLSDFQEAVEIPAAGAYIGLERLSQSGTHRLKQACSSVRSLPLSWMGRTQCTGARS